MDILMKIIVWINLIVFFAYFWLRFCQRKIQKINGWNNFEFWVYYNLIDYYKYNHYPFPEEKAKQEINLIIKRLKEECNI